MGSHRLTVVGPCGSWSWAHPHLPTSQAHGPGRTTLGSWPWAHPAHGCGLTLAHGRGLTLAQEALLAQVSATVMQGLIRRSLHTGLPIRLEDLAGAAEGAEPRAAASPIENVPQREPASPPNGAAPLPAGSEVSLAAEVPGGPAGRPCWLQPVGPYVSLTEDVPGGPGASEWWFHHDRARWQEGSLQIHEAASPSASVERRGLSPTLCGSTPPRPPRKRYRGKTRKAIAEGCSEASGTEVGPAMPGAGRAAPRGRRKGHRQRARALSHGKPLYAAQQAVPGRLPRGLSSTLCLRGPVGKLKRATSIPGRSLMRTCGSSRWRPFRTRTSSRRRSGTRLWTPCRTKQARRLVLSQKGRILYRRVPRLRGSRRRLLLLRPRHWLRAVPSLRSRASRPAQSHATWSRASRPAQSHAIGSGRQWSPRCIPSRTWLQLRQVLPWTSCVRSQELLT